MVFFRQGALAAHAIILEKPINDVIGVAECSKEDCDWKLPILFSKIGYDDGTEEYNVDKLRDEVANFLLRHRCCRPVKSKK